MTLGHTDARRHSPAAERNAAPILAELKRLLPPSGLLLEIASGTGQHAAFCGAGLLDWTWLPSDAEAEALPSIRAWCAGLPNVREPIQLDVRRSQWPDVTAQVDAIYCANMIHIAPWACCVGLFGVAARHLAPQGLLITYGPYLEDEVPTAPSNMAFDSRLRSEDAAWGLRRREDVEQVAAQAGLSLRSRIEMPANNLMLIWGRSSNS